MDMCMHARIAAGPRAMGLLAGLGVIHLMSKHAEGVFLQNTLKLQVLVCTVLNNRPPPY